jgi:hypothetical protein
MDKRLSFINEGTKKDLTNIEHITIDDYDAQREKAQEPRSEEKQQMASFFLKFERFMPASVVMKAMGEAVVDFELGVEGGGSGGGGGLDAAERSLAHFELGGDEAFLIV